jgi:hypothetical protein
MSQYILLFGCYSLKVKLYEKHPTMDTASPSMIIRNLVYPSAVVPSMDSKYFAVKDDYSIQVFHFSFIY